MSAFMKAVVSFLVWLYFKYLTYKESKKLKDKIDRIKEDKDIKEAIQNGDAKEVYRIIQYYGKYGKES